MPLEWAQVVDFIARQDPALAAALVGANPRDVQAAQDRLGITLPVAYLDFLATMGEHSGPLHPFGESRIHAFSELLDLPPDQAVPKRFFKIAVEGDSFAVAFLDTYLDLSRSDGYDAPTVTFETPVDPDHTDFAEDSLTFAERVVYHIFWSLDVSRREFGARVVIFNLDDWKGPTEKKAPVDLLVQAGFAHALPELPQVACLSQSSVSALLSLSSQSRLVAVDIGGDTRDAVTELVAGLLAQFPEANLQDAPARRSES